jgi:hypothetical protein
MKTLEGYDREQVRVIIVLTEVAHVEIHPETVAIYMKSGKLHVFPHHSNSNLAGVVRALLEDAGG